MSKVELIKQIVGQLEQELATLLHASDEARHSATHSESKAENKYDTRGLEAAYLAHGLSVRAQELQQAIAALRGWEPRPFGADDAVGLGALVTLEDEVGHRRRVLLAPQGGGRKGTFQGDEVTLVTPSAPMGQALTGRELDDAINLTLKGQPTCYCLVELC